jgi:lipopolysaccharide cholinephosphotransferase
MRFLISNICEKRLKKYKFSESEYVRFLWTSKKKREWFDDVKYLDFEGYQMPVPFGVEESLKVAYGDYMKFPPINKMKPATRNLFFYDLDHSYLDYKGIKYCVKNKN